MKWLALTCLVVLIAFSAQAQSNSPTIELGFHPVMAMTMNIDKNLYVGPAIGLSVITINNRFDIGGGVTRAGIGPAIQYRYYEGLGIMGQWNSALFYKDSPEARFSVGLSLRW